MENVNKKSGNLPSLIRRIARIWSILCFAFFVFIIIMEILFPHGGEGWRPRDVALAAFIPVGVFLGMALAWRREGLGGAITTLSAIGFYPGDVYLGWGSPSARGLCHAGPCYYSRDPLLDLLVASPKTVVSNLKHLLRSLD